MCTTDNSKQAASGAASRLARKNILELAPYRCARDDYSEGVLLDANENAFGPPTRPEHIKDPLERYPDPYQVPLKQKLAAHRGNELESSNIFVGVGSDEAIDLLMRIFCVPGKDKIVQTPPTYGMYKVCAKINDVEVVNVPLTADFDLIIPNVRLTNRYRVHCYPRPFLNDFNALLLHVDFGSHNAGGQTALSLFSRKSYGQGVAVGRH
jgi:histidinol-phosphate aminotransferase